MWVDIDGRVECVGLVIVGDGTTPLTASILRRLPLGTVITGSRRQQLAKAKGMIAALSSPEWLQANYRKWEESGSEGPPPPLASPAPERIQLEDEKVQRLTARRRRYDVEHYERVAEIYDEAIAAGIPPTAHVQYELGLRTRTQAAKQVARARERGLLPPTEQRVPKGNE